MASDNYELPPPYSAGHGVKKSFLGAWNPGYRLIFRRSARLRLACFGCLVFIAWAQWKQLPGAPGAEITAHGLSVKRLQADLRLCSQLRTKPVDPVGIGRERNGRYIEGHKPTLIKNATVWVGEPSEGASPEDIRSGKAHSWIQADVFLEHGLIKHVAGTIPPHKVPKNVLVYNARARPLTSGIIDMHSHLGVHGLPTLHGNEDVSELVSDITPYVRAIDGIQPTDYQIQVIKSGGVTTSLVLPGSSNNIGGEAFVIKHAVGRVDGRNETSNTDLLADPDRTWRYMKMACGENAKHVHGKVGERGPLTRLGESWEFRRAFDHAVRLLQEQEDWCDAAVSNLDRVASYLPVDIEWEALIAVLRGQAHVHAHCYTVPDLEAFVEHSNKFNFSVRAFHHAHQAYLVPEIIKRAWGDNPPAVALFADNMWYKAESFIASEYAGKHLYEAGLTPLYVSDNPVINGQHVVFEAAKAYKYGLPYHAALAAVTSAPAKRLGLGERLGKVKPGFDADIVIWDSDPLSVGATPVQVWIDGTAQYEEPVAIQKTYTGPMVPNEDLGNVVEEPNVISGDVVFTGITKSLLPTSVDNFTAADEAFNVAVSSGSIICVGPCHAELQAARSGTTNGSVVRLRNGHLTASYHAFGSTLGLNAVDSEHNTDNGADGPIFSRGVDGLALDTQKLRVARRYGVTSAVSAPKFTGGGTHHGTSVGFSTGAASVLEPGAVWMKDAALHYTLDLSARRGDPDTPSTSAAVGALRRKLLEAATLPPGNGAADTENPYSESGFLRRVVAGKMLLSITVHSADTIAAVLQIKEEVEAAARASGWNQGMLRMGLIGGAEAHLLAGELAAAGVPVTLAPLQSYAMSWDQRRALTGPPLTNRTAVDVLAAAGVVVAIGLEEDWLVRDLGLLAGIAHRNSQGGVNEVEAMGMVSGNGYEVLGAEKPEPERHFLIHEGHPFEIDSRVKVVADGGGHVYVY